MSKETDMSEARPRITGSPEEIWLVYEDLEEDAAHDEFGEVGWCATQQFSSDVRYVRADLLEARASERADLVELRRLANAAEEWVLSLSGAWELSPSEWQVGYKDAEGNLYDVLTIDDRGFDSERLARFYTAANPVAVLGLIAEVERLTLERDGAQEALSAALEVQETVGITLGMAERECESLRAELSRASATAQSNADTKAVMEGFESLLAEISAAAMNDGVRGVAVAGQSLRQFVERLTQGMKEMKALAKRLARDYTRAIAEKNAEIQRLQGLSATEPAATASRTVSEQELHDEFTELLHKLSVELYEGGKRGDSGAGYETTEALRQFVLRLIPAPSVAEPAKCGTCGGTEKCGTCGGSRSIEVSKGSLTSPDGAGGEDVECEDCDGTGDCPDCTPASAERGKPANGEEA